MISLIHWFTVHEAVLSILATVGVALLLVCSLVCTNCSCREKDDIFRHREI